MRKIFLFLILCFALQAENPYRIYNNFNAGELTPLLNIREDLAKYQSGCSIMENMIPLPQGGAMKRPGTKYIAEVKTSSLATRLIPFGFSTSQSYIVEAGNQYMRFYTNSAAVKSDFSSEDLSAFDSAVGDSTLVAHWLLNDDAASTAVLDDTIAGSHDAVMSSSNTEDISSLDPIGSGSLNFSATEAAEITDDIAFTFGDGTADSPFSLMANIYISAGSSAFQTIVSKSDTGVGREWSLYLDTTDNLKFAIIDDSVSKISTAVSDTALSQGWHFVVATYDGVEGAAAANGMTLYVDGAAVSSTKHNEATYVAMENTAADVAVGGWYSAGVLQDFWLDRLDNVAVLGKELSADDVATIFADDPYEIATPYLTADLFDIKYEQSADVLYITHSDYEPRELSRLANNAWNFDVIDMQEGPFRTQNSDVAKTIAASATTGSVTLTAVGHQPFISNATTGHVPSGSLATSKSQTGALFKLVHPLADLSFSDTLEDDIVASSTEGVSWMACGTLYKGATWSWVTGGTWLGTVAVQRNYTIGAGFADAGWETVLPFDGVATARNVSESGTEDDGDADYRVAFIDDTSGTIESYFSTDQTEVVGIVKITAVTNSMVATGTVTKTLGATNATYKWSEGSWSNYRGWPGTLAFFEDRLMFGGNTNQPDTIWGSVSSQYDNMRAGADDSDAVIFTLSSRQVNVIEWMVGKDKLLIGTSGAEWTIAGGTDEPLTPSNVIAKKHSTYGSANLQANLANESVLFFQRGSEKMRELAYNWELASYVAPDMTILANFVTNTGITDTAFQRTPNSILWTTRADGEMPIFSYERAENITAWSRMITQTNLAGTLTDSDIESVAVINGDPEDEIWVVVERTIDSDTVRYIEQFQDRDFGADPCDAYYVDCGVTYDSTALSAMTGGLHLAGETVSVLADGVVFDDAVVTALGAITLKLAGVTTTAKTVHWGLPYEVHLRTMPLSWVAQGQTIQGRQKRISEVIASWYESGDFSVGKSASNLETYSITSQTTDMERKTFPPGFDRNGYVYIYQKSPEPLTLLALMIEFDVQ